MDENRIIQEMKELSIKLSYEFKDISLLSKAMRLEKIKIPNAGKNHDEYANEAFATVGDTILKAVIADKLYSELVGITKGELTKKKERLENNEVLHKITCEEGIIGYAFNAKHFQKDENVPEHEKVVSKGYDAYIEAIVAAIYYDSNFETTKKWIYKYLYPLLEKYMSDVS